MRRLKCRSGHETELPEEQNWSEVTCSICGGSLWEVMTPGNRGVNRANTEVNRRCTFERGDALADLKVQAKVMEEMGQFRGARGQRSKQKVERLMKRLEATPPERRKRDFEKGHPLDH